jgi:hypothetical protein
MATYYEYWFRLNRKDYCLIWYSNAIDGVIINQTAHIPIFKDHSSLLQYSTGTGIQLKDEFLLSPSTNLDVVKKWLENPRKTRVPCQELLSAWNLFTDVANSVGDKKYDNNRKQTKKIYSKLFWGSNLSAVTPSDKHYVPIWKKVEIVIIRETLEYGLKLFRSRTILVE